MGSPKATAVPRSFAMHGMDDVRAGVGMRVASLLRLPWIALVIIGLGFLPGVMAPPRPFAPVVPLSQGQDNQGPFEEDPHRADVELKVFAEKHRRTGGLLFERSPKPCTLDAFLASLRPVLARDAAPVAAPDVPDALGIALRRQQLPRRGGPDEDPAV
ncbi:hypothetical protein [Corallococcus carmarthensis]|uniref:Uncharacterized protein n=1 Tax=Corallococcus carmarthensis TaxID=2316728 RepID=A0A3A8JZS4_9BACT|nr:hypothetical protein [Corallococcus carmarthensis]NOK19930.1 hypothetical protein [Corallococcus carmarthensis]RKH01498.1 hypothetical protein D7X32_19945 [Corallococcus carmarthensis]